VLAFEFINWFHDTANAVATVVYTRSMPPRLAVMWSGFMNFLGVLLGGTLVAMSVVKLLPVQTLLELDFTTKVAYFLSVLVAAIIWNFYTRYRGLPSSSMHALVWALLWVTAAFNLHEWVAWTNMPWHKLQEIFLSLLISPIVWLLGTLVIMWVMYHFARKSFLFKSPDQEKPNQITKSLMILACSAVSFAHWSNDGQKWVWVMMAVLVTFFPLAFFVWRVPFWVIATIATVLWVWSMIGWQRIAKTIWEKIGKHKMTYAQWLTSEFVAAITIALSTFAWLPVSTTQVLSSWVAGSAIATWWIKDLHISTMKNMLLAWLFTLPCTVMLGYILYFFANAYVR
jgi:phosphate/sulfate permease